jgi:hypothetical protein
MKRREGREGGGMKEGRNGGKERGREKSVQYW